MTDYSASIFDPSMTAGRRASQAEKQAVVVDWNQTRTDYPRESSIAELFEAVAESSGHTIAVEYQGKQLSYSELNRQANQLAHYLRAAGVMPEDLIGVCGERSLEMPIVLLGILKAGAAYVPMDPRWPAERLRWMADDSSLRFIITDENFLGVMPHEQGRHTFCLALERGHIARQSSTNPPHTTQSSNLAYVIYTSGSTGTPKGVTIEQHSVVRLVRNTNYAKLGPDEVLLQLAPIFFDAATFEIWGALLNGGKLVIAPARALSTREIGEIIRDRQITTLFLTTSLFHRMADERVEDLRPLRQLISGGDVLLPGLVRKAALTTLVIDGYGPTENTTFTSCFAVTDLAKVEARVPIGKPVANTQVYILDEQMEPVPVGVAGELYAGGEGLARGYLNRFDLTAEKFVPNPFSNAGERLYRTGDWARWQPDGNIEFLGRIDHQVKIRGFRVETGEVEAVLNQHPELQSAVVVAHEHRVGEKSLTAYLVASSEIPVSARELRTFLTRKLPDYMVPSLFIFLEQLPITPTGKVDRQALCEHNDARPAVPAANQVEEALLRICSQVLAEPSISLNSSFIELGGNSIDAIRVISDIRDTLSLDLPIKELFTLKTLRELALELQAYASPSFRHRSDRDKKRYPASASQERVWFIHRMEPSTTAYHFAARITFLGELNIEALSQALSTIVERHEIYRTTFDYSGQLFQIIHGPWKVSLDIINVGNQRDSLDDILIPELRAPFNLGALPLVRWKLVRFHAHKHTLLAIEHHLVHDGWSFNVFLKELTELYRERVEGCIPSIHPSPLQYVDFTQWQREWLETSEAGVQLEYWKNKLAGVPPLQFPFDHARGAVQTYSGKMETLELDEALLNDLHAFALTQEATLFMVFFAAFQILIFRYSGQEDFCIGTGIAGRRWHETKDLIGMLVNNIGLRTQLHAQLTIKEVIQKAKHITLEGYAHQDVPFDRVVRAVSPTRDPRFNPLFQVALSFHDSPVECAALQNMSLEVEVGLSNGAAKFDLSVVVIPAQRHNLPPGYEPVTKMLWEYNADLLEPETIRQMTLHYRRILTEVLRKPDQRISEISGLPLSGNQKLHHVLPASPGPERDSRLLSPPDSELRDLITKLWSRALGVKEPGVYENFFDLGGHSLLLANVHAEIEAALGRQFPLVRLFEHPTIASLANFLEGNNASVADLKIGRQTPKQIKSNGSEIAIVGMACRFPGANSIDEFWSNLRRGLETVSALSQEELAALPAERVNRPNFVNAVGRLHNLDLFDSAFFGLSPAEAAATDPQQRLLLECAWEALESAGYSPGTGKKTIGVFAGSGESRYRDLVRDDKGLSELLGEMQLLIGTGKDHIAPRLSYLFDLKGPSVPVNTACSTSLVAVHFACRSLTHLECDLAIAAASSIAVSPAGYLHEKGGILSADGHCRTFDASATGTVPGSGVGVLILKRLEEALADGDHIHAVIKGSAINNDGAAKVGYTAPSIEGQREVIRQALRAAGVTPDQLSYIEAHGTATALGDQIEVEALRQVFAHASTSSGTCAIGAVKTNIGHCDSAAGMAGLIKTILCLENQLLVPTVNFQQANPALHLEQGPLYVNRELAPWSRTPRIAGVSSFGIGGTNAHLVVGEAAEPLASGLSRPWQLITVAARTESSLARKKSDLVQFLQQEPSASLADVAFTANSGRKAFPMRQAFVFRGSEEAIEALGSAVGKAVILDSSIEHSVVFLFPGQGKAYTSFGQDLYREERHFREVVDHCSRHLLSPLGANLSEMLFENKSDDPDQLHRPSFWQPALFVLDYAMARLWMSWGIKPTATIGHSLGEYVAATLAGVLDLEDALLLVAERGRLTEQLLPGAMLALHASERETQRCLGGSLSLAAINGPELCVVSGPVDEIARLEGELQRYQPVRLAASHAFHSFLVEPLMEPLNQLVSRFRLRAPSIPYLSTVSGTWITNEDATDHRYWARQLRQPVRFYDCLREVTRKPGRILLEVGPGSVLTDLARSNLPGVPAFSSLAANQPDGRAIARTLGKLWSHGTEPDWAAYYNHEKRHRIPLPTYPFERRSCWVQKRPPTPSTTRPADVREALENWFYVPTWKRLSNGRARALTEQLSASERWLIFADENALSRELARRLEELKQEVLVVLRGSSFQTHGDGKFTVNPSDPASYTALVSALQANRCMPHQVIHTWCVEGDEARKGINTPGFLGLESLLHVARAFTKVEGDKARMLVVTSNIHRVLDEAPPEISRATILGAIHVLENSSAFPISRHLDIDFDESPAAGTLADEILFESRVDQPSATVVYRRGQRWMPFFDRSTPPLNSFGSVFKQAGVYLITHALQKIGLYLAERLVHSYGAHVVLLDRSFLPPASEWERWVAEQGEDDLISRRISRLKTIAENIRVISADFENSEEMQRIKEGVERDLGAIAGVFHLEKAAWSTQRDSASRVRMLWADVVELGVLEKVFAGTELMVLFSKNLAECGELADAERAARSFLLAQFAEQAADRGERVVNIQWGEVAWNETGEDTAEQSSFTRPQGLKMGVADCVDALERALMLQAPDVIVSTRDFNTLLQERRLQRAVCTLEAPTGARWERDNLGGGHVRPQLSTTYEEPRNEIEKLVMEFWKAALGFQTMGIHDNFFELGGHSLLAIQLVKKINDTFSAQVALRDFFDAPTVAQLALIIAGKPSAGGDAEFLEAVLNELEGLSDEQVESALRGQA